MMPGSCNRLSGNALRMAALVATAALAALPGGPASATTHSTLIASANGGSSDDPAFPAQWDAFTSEAYSGRLDRDTPDAVYTSNYGVGFMYGLFPCRRPGLLWFDVSPIPSGRRVVRATLHLKTWWSGLNPSASRPDSIFACADTLTADARWVGANLATWSEPREGQSGAWAPALGDRANYRQFGIVSRPVTVSVPVGQDVPGVGWWTLDVTRGVQAWVNGRTNAGFWIFGRAWYDKIGSFYWSQASNPAYRPWLEVEWADEPCAGPWLGGRQIAFTFSTDDGFRQDNLQWADVLDSLGQRFTACVVDSFIQASPPSGPDAKLNDADLASLLARGHEVASHSVSHRRWNPATVPDSVVAWGVDPAAIERHLPAGSSVVSIAWPFHLHSARMCGIARDSGYLVGRNGGIDWGQYIEGSYCSWDSCRIYEVGLTCMAERVVADEDSTREYIRNCIRETIEHGNGWLNLYVHTTDGRYSSGIGVSRQQLIWVIDELVRSDLVWIDTMGNVARYYRQHHAPKPGDPLLWILDEPPIARDDAAETGARQPVVVDVLANDEDPDGSLQPASVQVVAGPSHGIAVVDAETGSITYAPATGFAGLDTLRYTVRDLLESMSAPAAVVVTVHEAAGPVAIKGISVAPGNGGVRVQWQATGAASSFEIWRGLWCEFGGGSAYPEYDDAPGSRLPLPHDSREGLAGDADWVLVATVPGTVFQYDDAPPVRGLFEYTVLGINTEGAPGAPALEPPLALDYLLGDVALVDGLVDDQDLAQLAADFGHTTADPDFDPYMDIGPTSDATCWGVPQTDNVIDFEDLMILALAYGSSKGPWPLLPRVKQKLPVLELLWEPAGDGQWLLLRLPNTVACRGLRLAADLPPSTVTVRAEGLLTGCEHPWFLRNLDAPGLDASVALLGPGGVLDDAGPVLSVQLPAGTQPGAVAILARDIANRPLLVQVATTTDVTGPRSVGLDIAPNPFNARATFALSMPAPGHARLEVFDLQGRLVARPLDRDLPAGEHQLTWDGTDRSGHTAATGTYLCRLRAGEATLVRRLSLIK